MGLPNYCSTIGIPKWDITCPQVMNYPASSMEIRLVHTKKAKKLCFIQLVMRNNIMNYNYIAGDKKSFDKCMARIDRNVTFIINDKEINSGMVFCELYQDKPFNK